MILQLLLAIYQTILMIFVPGLFAILIGLPLGVLLFITNSPSWIFIPRLNRLLGILVNIIRSIPFVILLVMLMPVTRFLLGTSIGTWATIIPLSIAAIPFFARLIESVLNGLNIGLVEAARSMGASNIQIFVKVLFPEAMSEIISAITVTLVNLVSYSSMAGVIGGGGLGDLAIRQGYQRANTKLMMLIVMIIIVLVQIIQSVGSKLMKLYSH